MRKYVLVALIAVMLADWIKIDVAVCASAHPDTTGIEVTRAPGALPQLGFACELETGPLQDLLNIPGVISDIKEMNANISLALIDLSKERAEAVQQLNRAGIPVIAWLVLPRDKGYYMNSGNSTQAIQRFADFETWTARYNLKWAGVGLDIEPDIAEFAMFRKSSKLKLAAIVLGRSVSLKRKWMADEAREIYSGFIKQIEAHGYPVQTYQLSFVGDERKVHSTLLDRIVGVVTSRGKTEAMMIYTSFRHDIGSALVWSYGPEAQAIVLGVTGGGADTASNSRFIPLSWKELSNDLIVASHFTNHIGIFSLEGCVRQDFLPRLKSFDWDQTVVISGESLKKAAHFRKGIQAAIWIVANLSCFFGFIILLTIWLFWRRRRRLAGR